MGMLEHYWTWFKTSWCVIYIYICIYKYICIHTNIHWIDIVWPHFKASHFQKNRGNEISEGSWASVDSLDSLERLSYWPATKSKNIYIYIYMRNIHQLGTWDPKKHPLKAPQTSTIMAPGCAEIRALAIKLLRSSPSLGLNHPGQWL